MEAAKAFGLFRCLQLNLFVTDKSMLKVTVWFSFYVHGGAIQCLPKELNTRLNVA